MYNGTTILKELTRVLFKEIALEITKNTRVSEILEEYGDIAPLMEVFGVRRVARYSFRKMLTKALTVEWAARVHRVPTDKFINILNQAISGHDAGGKE